MPGTRSEPARGEAVVQPVPDLDVRPELIETPLGHALVGTECLACGACMAGTRQVCSSCTSQGLRDVSLGPRGSLYSFTTVHVSPRSTEPYTLGYVDLTQGPRVLAVIKGPADALACGQPVRLVVNGEGWAFRPGD